MSIGLLRPVAFSISRNFIRMEEELRDIEKSVQWCQYDMAVQSLDNVSSEISRNAERLTSLGEVIAHLDIRNTKILRRYEILVRNNMHLNGIVGVVNKTLPMRPSCIPRIEELDAPPTVRRVKSALKATLPVPSTAPDSSPSPSKGKKRIVFADELEKPLGLKTVFVVSHKDENVAERLELLIVRQPDPENDSLPDTHLDEVGLGQVVRGPYPQPSPTIAS